MNKKRFKCDIGDCKYRSKWKCSLKQHKADVHDIDVIYHNCDVKGCNKICKFKGNLKIHKEHVHIIGVKLHKCNVGDCNKECKSKCNLKLHKASIHNIEVKLHQCDIEDCKYETKQKSTLKNHKMNIHNIGVMLHQCNIDGCEKKFKQKGNLKRHKTEIHIIGVKLYECDIKDCNYKCKRRGYLKLHKEHVHDIGTHKCEFCTCNRNSHILYKDNTGQHYICQKCYKTVTGKGSRIEHVWSDYIDKHLGTEYLSSNDKSLRHNGGCQLFRPDKLYIGVDTVELDECDENQHKYQNGSYECEENRISKIYDEDGICGKSLIVIRWNPDNYKVPPAKSLPRFSSEISTRKFAQKYTKKKRAERLKIMVDLKKHLRKNPPKDKIHIFYLFYDKDNIRISKNYKKILVYNSKDFEN